MKLIKEMIKKYLAKREKTVFNKAKFNKEKRFKSELDKNIYLNNYATKERCFILGNGPSIRDVNFSIFKNEDIFTVNQISRHPDFEKITIKCHFWADPMFFEDDKNHNPTISDELFEYMAKIPEKNINSLLFVVADTNNGVVKKLKEKYRVHHYVSYGCIKSYNKEDINLSKCLPGFNNVVQFAILTALAMGYKEIVLVGCEQTSLMNVLNGIIEKNASNKYYGYIISDKERNRMINQYNRYSVSLWLSQHAEMFKDFDELEKLSKEFGCKIYNTTEKTLCDSFEKKDLDSFFY